MVRSVYKITISSDNAAKKTPFIYAGLALNIGAIYVGETRSSQGAMGRIAQHISETSSNTFKKRICTIFKYDDVHLEEILFLAVPLSDYSGFWLKSNEYRRAVEYLVQNEMLNFIAEYKKEVLLVSRVTANGYCQTDIVKNEAKIVSKSMISSLIKVI